MSLADPSHPEPRRTKPDSHPQSEADRQAVLDGSPALREATEAWRRRGEPDRGATRVWRNKTET